MMLLAGLRKGLLVTIYIDIHEPPEIDFLLTRMGIEVKRGSFNKTGEDSASYPDFVLVTAAGMLGYSRKQAVEAMADLDRVEEQLSRELQVCEKLILGYEGFLAPHADGTYAGDLRTITHKTGRGGNEYDELTSRGRVIHQPYVRWLSFQWKLMDAGIPVVSTGDVQGSASFLAHLHKHSDNNLFRRLIPVRQQVLEQDPEKRQLALTLMGIQGARWGEEMAMAVADDLERGKILPLTVASVICLGEDIIARVPLRSGRRVVGKAAAQRLFAALGY